MDIIYKLNMVIEEVKKGHYGVMNIPLQLTDTDLLIDEIIEMYKNMNKEEKGELKKSISMDTAWQLLCYAIRMATYSLRLLSQKCFTNGLFAMSITLGILDERELLIVMPLYYDVQKKNSLSFDELLKRNDDFSIFLDVFINRKEEDKTLECMGYILENDENNNPIYRRTW